MKYTNIKKEYIFEENRPFESCHASTLLVLANGHVIASWFGGSKEGAGDVAIWISRREHGIWSAPIKVADRDSIPHWNPVLFVGENDRIYLFYKIGHTIPAWHTMVLTSDDLGCTWTAPRELVVGDRGGRGPVRNKAIRLSNGTWLAPASIEGDVWDAFVDISVDRGNSWTKSQLVPVTHSQDTPNRSCLSSLPVPEYSFKGKGIIQPTLWESRPGIVHMLLRSTEGSIFRSDSSDSGQSWCPAYPTSLPNNNSGIDLTRLPDGELVLVYNPVGENWGKRSPLVLRTSTDNGTSWTHEYILEDDEGEYSYPAIVSQGNDVYLTYTWKRERIVLWKITVEL